MRVRAPRPRKPPKGFEEFDTRSRDPEFHVVTSDDAHSLIDRTAEYSQPPPRRSKSSDISHASDTFHSYSYDYQSDNGFTPHDRLISTREAFASSVTYGPNVLGYRARIRAGLSATTSATGQRHTQASRGSYYWRYGFTEFPKSEPSFIIMSGNYAASAIPNPALSYDADVNNRALTNFISKARKAQSSTLGGEFLRDVRKTLDSFNKTRDIFRRSLAKIARKQYDLAKSVSLRERFFDTGHSQRDVRKRALRRLSENWLEYTYGIAPTVSDLEDQAFGLYRAYDRSKDGVDSKRIFGFSSLETITSSSGNISINVTGGSSKPRVFYDDSTWDQIYIEYSGSVRTLRSDSFIGNAGEELGLSLRSFVPTVWEFIPYSFVVDYFTNVGSIIDALVFPRSDLLWVNKLVRRETITTRRFRRGLVIPLNPGSKIHYDQFDSTPHVFKAVSHQRSAYTGSLVPSFRCHLPYRGTDWINLLALGITRFL